MSAKIRVTILDDHQSIIDGYLYRLGTFPQIEVVDTLRFGEELEPALAQHPADVLLLDIHVPTSPDNPNPYPVLFEIPKLLDRYAGLSVLVITMHNERSLIRSVMETGASGFVLKDDQTMIRDLGNVIVLVWRGAIIFSQQSHQLLHKKTDAAAQEQLSNRQAEILSLCAAYPDLTSGELANKLALSHSTVRNLLSDSYLRLGVHTRLAAVSKARELGIITPYTHKLK